MNQAVELVILVRRLVSLSSRVAPECTALAIQGGRIVWVGDEAEGRRLALFGARLLDRRDTVAIPGLVDTHAHLTGLGKALVELDLRHASSPEEVAQRVADSPGTGWIIGRGWDQNRWTKPVLPSHTILDAVSPHRPVALTRIDGHALWVNRAALNLAGLGQQRGDPPGGRVVRDSFGRATGILIDNAMNLVESRIPQPKVGEVRARIQAAVKACHQLGLTGVHDMSSDGLELEVLRGLAHGKMLDLRVDTFVDPTRAGTDEWLESPQHQGLLTIGGVKLFADGALGSRGAHLFEPYCDASDQRGLVVTTAEDLLTRTARYSARGFQVAIHAIGDAAGRAALDAFAGSQKVAVGAAPRFRLEHAQILQAAERARLAPLGVGVTVQPIHYASDAAWAELRLGPDRLKSAYAWRSLRAAGARVGLGSDFPVDDPSPLLGLFAAVHRRRPGEASLPLAEREEAFTPEEALRGYTTEAAYLGRVEGRRGQLHPGADADLTLLSGDPRCLEDLEHLKVVATIIAGEVLYEA